MNCENCGTPLATLGNVANYELETQVHHAPARCIALLKLRAERAEETIAIFTAPYEPDMKCGTFLPVDPVLEAARRPIRVDAAIWERRAEELRAARAEVKRRVVCFRLVSS